MAVGAFNSFVEQMGLSDQAIDADTLPWVPQGEQVWFQPLRFDLANGRWVNLIRMTGE